MEFWPLKSPSENSGVHRDSNSQSWTPLGVWGFTSPHSLALPGACGVTPKLPLGPQPCNPLALVTSPRLGRNKTCLLHFSTKFCRTSFEKAFCDGNYNWGHRCIHSLFNQTFSTNCMGKFFLTTNKHKSSTNFCCSPSPSLKGLLVAKKSKIEKQ